MAEWEARAQIVQGLMSMGFAVVLIVGGLLEKVMRPDGQDVYFTYDPVTTALDDF